MLKYKGYSGVVEYDSDENILFGKIINAKKSGDTIPIKKISMVSPEMSEHENDLSCIRKLKKHRKYLEMINILC